MRAYVFADVLGRTLSWKGYKLTHVINITDVGHLTDDADAGEDKLEKAAAEKAQSIWDIAKHYTEAYWADVKALNIREPAKWSVATDYIDEMLEFAKQIAPKHCYELDSGLYFDVSTVEDYGRLARAVTEEGEGRILAAPAHGLLPGRDQVLLEGHEFGPGAVKPAPQDDRSGQRHEQNDEFDAEVTPVAAFHVIRSEIPADQQDDGGEHRDWEFYRLNFASVIRHTGHSSCDRCCNYVG